MFTEKLASRSVNITNLENNGSGLIKVTSGTHGLSTGDEIIIAGEAGVTAANGFWTVTVTSTTQFTLDGSAFSGTFVGGCALYDGVSWAVYFASAPSSNGVLAVANIKQIDTSGAVVGIQQTINKITTTAETEFMGGDATYAQALSSLKLTNNSGASVDGQIKIRTTKGLSALNQIVQKFTLPTDYSLVIGGDGVISLYKDTALPYVS